MGFSLRLPFWQPAAVLPAGFAPWLALSAVKYPEAKVLAQLMVAVRGAPSGGMPVSGLCCRYEGIMT